MAEGPLGSLLSEAEEKSEADEREGDENISRTAEAFAAAVAAMESRGDPQVATDTSAFLKKQCRLLDLQSRHLEEEHPLRLAHLRNQLSEEAVRRLGLRLRVAFQIFLSVVATVLGLGFLVIVHDAITAHNIVVEPFETSASLGSEFANGKLVANTLLDELRTLQVSTRGGEERRELSRGWAEEIKIEVPEVGISIGEVSRLLESRWGHNLRVEGDLIKADANRIALTLRSPDFLSKTLTAPADEVHTLMIRGAEYVYSQAEPVLWAYYLSNQGRDEEAIEFSRNAVATASQRLRPYLFNTWANAARSLGRPESIELYRAAIALKPDYWAAHYNLQLALACSGDEEAAYHAAMEMQRRAGGRPGRATEDDFQILDWLTQGYTDLYNSLMRDAEAHGGIGSRTVGNGSDIADTQISRHDFDAAHITLQTLQPDPSDTAQNVMIHLETAFWLQSQGKLDEAVHEAEMFRTGFRNPVVKSQEFGSECWVAPMEEAAGHYAEADEILRTSGRFVDCFRFRGDILDGRGDWAGAQNAYAQAVALAPDLPAAYYSWGMALLRHRDLAGARSKLQAAHERGRRWAEPLKGLGDVSAAQGHRTDALADYNAALQWAPAWKELQQARLQVMGNPK